MTGGQSDGELVAAALGGNQAAFGELVRRYRDAVLAVAFHRLGDFDDACDAAQETFVKAYLKLSTLKDRTLFVHWLYRVADGIALDAARRLRREMPLEQTKWLDASGFSPQQRAEQAELARKVREALATLSEPTRLAVILHYVTGYSHAEVAHFLGVTVGAVKTRLSRARTQLRKELSEMVRDKLRKAARLLRYAAEGARGLVTTGTAEAGSEAHLRGHLSKAGFRVVSVRPVSEEQVEEEARQAPYRVARVILETAAREDADSIRIVLGETGDPSSSGRVAVSYLVGGVWHTRLTMSHYVWEPLRKRLSGMAGIQLREKATSRTGRIRFQLEGKKHEFKTVVTATSILMERSSGE
jgi:RNA polymerase sigma-70 factor (ECF subfamily)